MIWAIIYLILVVASAAGKQLVDCSAVEVAYLGVVVPWPSVENWVLNNYQLNHKDNILNVSFEWK